MILYVFESGETMKKTCHDQVIIITGAASGIGLASTKACLLQGSRVMMIDLNQEALDKAHQALHVQYPNHVFKACVDVSNADAFSQVIDDVMDQFNRIDALFNNAGIEGKQAPLSDYDDTIFKRVLDVNIMGVYYGMKFVLPWMKKQGHGIILNASSVVGFTVVPNQSAFIASKHAVIGLTKSAAVEYGQFNIQVNALAPGGILTPMMENALKGINPDNPEAIKTMLINRNPSKRLGTPEEIGVIVASIFAGNLPYVNGETIVVDGGLSIRWS